MMVLQRQLEICESNGNRRSDNQENDEDKEEDAIEMVRKMSPDRVKKVMKLNVNTTKRVNGEEEGKEKKEKEKGKRKEKKRKEKKRKEKKKKKKRKGKERKKPERKKSSN